MTLSEAIDKSIKEFFKGTYDKKATLKTKYTREYFKSVEKEFLGEKEADADPFDK